MEAVVFGLVWARASFSRSPFVCGTSLLVLVQRPGDDPQHRNCSPRAPAPLNMRMPAFLTAASSARPRVMSRLLLRLGRVAPITGRPLHRLAQAPPVACSRSSKVTL